MSDLDLSRHPILRATYDAGQAVERCGASPELTHAAALIAALPEHAAALLDERDALRADAERYRWLRGGPDVAPHSVRWACWEIKVWKGYWCPLANDELDAAIDAARAKEQK